MIKIKYRWKYLDTNKSKDRIIDYGVDGNRIWLDDSYDSQEEAMKALSDFLEEVEYFDEELILVTESYANHLV